jgi:hypothetical protein
LEFRETRGALVCEVGGGLVGGGLARGWNGEGKGDMAM